MYCQMFPVAMLRRRRASYGVMVTMVTVATLVSVTSSVPAIPSLVRPFYCEAPNDRLFVDCFMCGRLMEDERIYYGCCARHQLISDYCDQLLA